MNEKSGISAKAPAYGQILFGASAVLFGAICLMWHDADTWQNLTQIWRLPLGSFIGAFLMIAQIAGGIGIAYRRTARPASIVLGIVYMLFSLACIPPILAAPANFGQYDAFFEQFCFLSAVLAVYAATGLNSQRPAAIGRWARLGLGLSTVSFTVAQIYYLRETADLVPKWIPPNQMFWAVLTTVAFAAAAIAILINRHARLAMFLMTLMVGMFGVLVWIPLLVAHPESHGSWSEFALTALIAGASWTVADATVL
ncbi:MAG TPA: hypothetical protein VF753_14310 [Terriglobales bacterium]